MLMRINSDNGNKAFFSRLTLRSIYDLVRGKNRDEQSKPRRPPVAIIPYVYDHEAYKIRERFQLDGKAGKKIEAILFHDREGLGPERSFEHCWQQCPDRDIVILHSDMWPMPSDKTNAWWDRLLEYRDTLSDAGMIACNLMYPNKDHPAAGQVQCAGGTFANGVIDYYRGNLPTVILERVRIVDWVTFGGVFIRRELLNACGSFDRRYKWAYVMDVDYCFEARRRGFLLYQVPVWLTHYENGSTRSMLENDPAAKAAVKFNRQAFYDKWRLAAPYLPSTTKLAQLRMTSQPGVATAEMKSSTESSLNSAARKASASRELG